jgi:hypothetical protein
MHEAWTLWTAAFDELRADIEEYTDECRFVICTYASEGAIRAAGAAICCALQPPAVSSPFSKPDAPRRAQVGGESRRGRPPT